MKHLLFCSILVLLLVAQACKTVKTTAPAAAYQTFEYVPPQSQIVVPVELSLRDLEALLNRQLDGLLYSDEDYEDDLMMKVWKISPIRLSMNKEDIVYEVPVKIWSKFRWEFKQFGFTLSDEYVAEGAIRITFHTQLKVGPFWDVQPQTNLERYEWIQKPIISGGNIVLPVNLIADRVIKAQQKTITAAIDDQIKKNIELRKYVEEGWNAVHQPVLLYNNPATWLRIRPSAIYITPLSGNADFVYATIRIDGVAETFVGTKPNVLLTNLPNVAYTNNGSGTFTVSLVNDISYADATRLANEYLDGQVFTSPNGKKKVKIDSVHVYGGGDQLVVQTRLSGSLNGTIYLKGKPSYDSLTQTIYLKDLDYTVDTKNVLAKTASWIGHSMLVKKMQESLRYSVAEDLTQIRKVVAASMTDYVVSKNVSFSGTLTNLYPGEIFVTSESIKAVIYANGTLKMLVKGLDIP